MEQGRLQKNISILYVKIKYHCEIILNDFHMIKILVIKYFIPYTYLQALNLLSKIKYDY